jgi:putative pyruvate formate lyase activating enzyme
LDPFASCEYGISAAYLNLLETGELTQRARDAREMLRHCLLCPRKCGVDRIAGELGACGIGANPFVSSYGPHFGEESVLVGRYGSGTIFFTGCNLKCVFCQNYEISQLCRGDRISDVRLAEMMLELQSEGCHNINFVTPTHQVPQILEAIVKAAESGLRLPLVYNCGGYESVETLRLLDGIVDIYMPDAKYGDNEAGRTYSGVPDYWDRCREAIREMHRQVGDLQIREVACDNGRTAKIATRGLLVRHLVLPNNLASSDNVFRFIANEISKDTFINVMGQYRPEYRAREITELSRRVTANEFREAFEQARRAGLHRFAD